MPGWALVKKIYPSGNVQIDPYMSGDLKRVSINALMDADWVKDAPRRKITPCNVCGHYNHDGYSEGCNVFVESKGNRKEVICGCTHDMRQVLAS